MNQSEIVFEFSSKFFMKNLNSIKWVLGDPTSLQLHGCLWKELEDLLGDEIGSRLMVQIYKDLKSGTRWML